jgi:hypothetical protein
MNSRSVELSDANLSGLRNGASALIEIAKSAYSFESVLTMVREISFDPRLARIDHSKSGNPAKAFIFL